MYVLLTALVHGKEKTQFCLQHTRQPDLRPRKGNQEHQKRSQAHQGTHSASDVHNSSGSSHKVLCSSGCNFPSSIHYLAIGRKERKDIPKANHAEGNPPGETARPCPNG